MNVFKKVAVFSSLMVSVSVPVQAAIENAGEIDSSVAQLIAGQARSADPQILNNVNWRTGTYRAADLAQDVSDETQVRPFGSQLFEGGFRGLRSDGMNSDYRVTPGDQIVLRIWGAVEIEKILPVDARGNVFIPTIGPVQVQGLSHRAFDGKIRAAVRSVYPENVNVYTNLQGVQPVAVFVTGFVTKPGRYAGTPNDSAIYFLDQAGGIDDALGSYREIQVIRSKRVIASIDLYEFLRAGRMSRIQFRDGDTILVKERKTSVSVTGDVEREFAYELKSSETSGDELLQLVRSKAGVSHVLLQGDRENGPLNTYLSLEHFKQQSLSNGDEVLLSIDKRLETVVVEVEGSYLGASRFALPKGYMLHDLLNAIAVPEELTDVDSISIKRESVAARQKASLQESLKRLETTYLGASSSTPQEAAIRVQEAQLINRFIDKASKVEPSGRLVVSTNGHIANIRLQNGDVITIPERSDSLLISGEVLVPQSVVFTDGRSVEEYIAGAGGLTQHADDDHILVVRQNGEVRNADGVTLQSGDEIVVLPKVPTKNLQLATSISQILYQIAVAAKVINDI